MLINQNHPYSTKQKKELFPFFSEITPYIISNLFTLQQLFFQLFHEVQKRVVRVVLPKNINYYRSST